MAPVLHVTYAGRYARNITMYIKIIEVFLFSYVSLLIFFREGAAERMAFSDVHR